MLGEERTGMDDDWQDMGADGDNSQGLNNGIVKDNQTSPVNQPVYQQTASGMPQNSMQGAPYSSSSTVPGQPTEAYGQPLYGAAPASYQQQTSYYNGPQAQPSGPVPSQQNPMMPSVQQGPGVPMPQGQPYAPQYQPQGYQQFNGQPSAGSDDDSYSGLSIAAIITAVLIWPVGLILSIISLIGFNKDDRKKGKGLSIAALAVSVVFGVVSILMVIGAVNLADRVLSYASSQPSYHYSEPSSRAGTKDDDSPGTGSRRSKHYKSIQDWLDNSSTGKQLTQDLQKLDKDSGVTATWRDGGNERLVLDVRMDDGGAWSVLPEQSDDSVDDLDTTNPIAVQVDESMKEAVRSLKKEGFDHPSVELFIHNTDDSYRHSLIYDENGRIS